MPVCDARVADVFADVSERCSHAHVVIYLNLNIVGLKALATHWDRYAWGGEDLWGVGPMISRIPHHILAPTALQDALEAALRGARAR